MKRHLAILVLAVSITGLTACASPGAEKADAGTEERALDADLHQDTHALGDLGKVGEVRFPTSCDPRTQPDFTRAVALLHSFFYEEARRVFTTVAEKNPDCAIAHWGVAMTWYHPVWAPPTDEEFKAGVAAVAQAREGRSQTELERGYIDALATFFCTPQPDGTRPAGDGCPAAHGDRARRYTEAMARLHARYPDEEEAAAFYGLALLGSATPADPTFVNQLKAGEILDQVWRANRHHPGATHYLIHAFDHPRLAAQGLAAAKAYAGIAPRVPHALHMPSHTFTRRGLWRESIDTNLASAEAARAYAAKYHPGAASFEELHALDYLVYGYLQTAQTEEARKIVQLVADMQNTHPEIDFVVAYAMGAIPARFALERQMWQEAASLPVPPRPFWAQFSFAEAHIEFARALGRTKIGDLTGARRSVERLAYLRDAVTGPRYEYFRRHIDVQVQAASGWLAAADGRSDEGFELLRRAADVEDALGKHPVSPGAVFPVRELLGYALMEAERPAEALAAFEESLRLNPGRFAAVYGAGRAAEGSGKTDVAAHHYRQLLSLAERVDPASQPALAHARSFVDR